MRYATDFEIDQAFPLPKTYKYLGDYLGGRVGYLKTLKNEKAVVRWNQPGFMTFLAIKNKAVPSLIVSDVGEKEFPKLFGEGVKLKQITIEMTDEPVSHELTKHIPSILKLNPAIFRTTFVKGDQYKNL